uniref:MICOS complex subunit n=1 Tax=Panagrellus redivivus TaxID=6233 RepID=A0A7E4ZRD4_PANRE
MVFAWFFEPIGTPVDSEETLKRLEKTRVERELALREAIVERQNAYKLAEAKERLTWAAPSGILTAALAGVAAVYHKNLSYTVPILPILAYLGHEAHLVYGNQLDLILKRAESVLSDNTKLSTRAISVREVEARVQQQREATVWSCVDISD